MRNKFKLFLTTSFIIINLICYVIASKSYVGNQQLFFIYAISINFYLIYSFREKSFFFEKILSLFLWLGFWFKFVFVLIFSGNFREGTGNFDYSPEMFDKGLFISLIAIILLIFFSLTRDKVLNFNYPSKLSSKNNNDKLKLFYIYHRKIILITFILAVSISALMNVNFSIYRKGIIHNEDVPFLIMSLFKWLTIFGFCSFSSFILFYEMKINKNILLGILVSLYEGLVTNIGFMSRAMIFNQLAIYLGVLKNLELNKKKIKLINWFLYLSLLFITFFVSIYLVTIDRDNKFHNYEGTKLILENVLVVERVLPNNEETKDILEKRFIVDSFFQKKFKEYPILNNFIYLILNRWIGLDAVFAVVSSDKLSFSFFKKSLGEKFDSTTHSFYEMEILERKKLYIKHGIDKNYGIIIPGFIAFSFYAGSILIMSLVILMLYSISIVIEYISFKLSNSNVIFSSLIGQVCAYRLIHFGYLPSQSYLLLFSILLNIILFYLIISIFKLKK